MAKHRCSVCNWKYDEEKEGKPFKDLPDSYICPICGAPKTAFVPDEGAALESADTYVATKIVEQLKAYEVKTVYGIPGDSNLPMIDAIRQGGLRFVLTRHEETAAFMASAHGKMTGELGVCISIAGPGCTNLITGLMDAATDRSPVLALTGQIPEIYLGSEGFQEIDEIELFKPFTEFAETVARPNQALRVTNMAIKYAYKKPGVSVLSTPTDVLVERLGEKISEPAKRLFKERVIGQDKNIKKVAELINSASKPAVFAGWGARESGELLVQLSEKINAPIATTSRAKGVIDETHNNSVGVLGSIGAKQSAKAIKNCDLIIILGSGFRQANLVPPGVKIVQVDVDPTRIGKTFNVDAGIIGDVNATLQTLLPQIQPKEKNTSFLEGVEKAKKEHQADIESDSSDLATPISPGYVIQALKRNAAKDAIITVDVGDHTYWFYKKFICSGQKTYMSANMASMGFSLPAALSAQIDFPDKQVIGVTGDGGFAMLMADFTTAVRENLPITMVVFNDGKLKNIKKEQNRDHYPEFGVEFPNPDFAAYAKTCGGEGFRVEDPHKLDKALSAALASDTPCIVDVLVDPDKMAPGTKKVD